MATSRRTLRNPARSPRESSPSTRISPPEGSARWLMQRSSVDLPAPEAPRMTTNSPLATLRLTSCSATKSP
jgi:hypothetical protein